MSKIKISTGTDNFKKLVTTSDVFVDKTLFIEEILDSGEDAILITRPRRWGKSLALDMLKTFFAIEVDASGNKAAINSNRVLFEGGNFDLGFGHSKTLSKLKISNTDPLTIQKQGQYPVILLSLKDARYKSYSAAESGLKHIIGSAFQTFMYLSTSTKLSDYHKAKVNKIINNPQEMTIEDLKSSLKFLSQLLYQHHKQKVYVLVDEFDKPVNYFLEQGIDQNIIERRQVAELVTSIMGACGKTNDYLEKIVLTGIFDVFVKEGNSGFNNLAVFGIGDIKFATSFGFTAEEIKVELMPKLQLGSNEERVLTDIKEWYNGYRLPLPQKQYLEVYTAWAVMKHISAVNEDSVTSPKGYWEESGVNWILEQLQIFPTTLEKLKKISEGTPESLNIPDKSLMKLLSRTGAELNESLIAFLLFNSGYLTLTEDSKYRLPNTEVLRHFRKSVLERVIHQAIKDVSNFGEIVSKLSGALHYKDEFLKVIQEEILSKVDGGDKSEAYFQSLVGGIIELHHLSNPDSYQTIVEKSVRSTGRIDNIFYPPSGNSDKPVIIHEYKKLDKTQSTEVVLTLEQSIWQILEQGYLGEPISKKLSHPLLHAWDKIELRGIVFIKDETNGKWTARVSEILSFTFEEAKKIQDFFAYSMIRQQLNLDNARKDISKVRQDFMNKVCNKQGATLKELTGKILDVTSPLLEDIKKKKTEDIRKNFAEKLGANQDAVAVAKYIIDHFDTDPKTLLADIQNKWSGITLTEDEVSNITEQAPKAKKAKKETTTATSSGNKISYTEQMSLDGIDSFFVRYYGSGIDYILPMRIKAAATKRAVYILESAFLEEETVSVIVNNVLTAIKHGYHTIALPLNIDGKHWVGLFIENNKDFLSATYLDSDNAGLVSSIGNSLIQVFAEHGYIAQLQVVQLEQQRYSNCGPELIENFAKLIIGSRWSQEEAVIKHSILVEQELLENRYAYTLSGNFDFREIIPYSSLSTEGQKPYSISYKQGELFNYVDILLRRWKFLQEINRLNEVLTKHGVAVNYHEALCSKDAYKQLMLALHPDKGGNKEDFQFYKELKESYSSIDTSHLMNDLVNSVNTKLFKVSLSLKGLSTGIKFIKTAYERNANNILDTAVSAAHLSSIVSNSPLKSLATNIITVGSVVYYNGMYEGIKVALTSGLFIGSYYLISSVPYVGLVFNVMEMSYSAYCTYQDIGALYQQILQQSDSSDILDSRDTNSSSPEVINVTNIEYFPLELLGNDVLGQV